MLETRAESTDSVGQVGHWENQLPLALAAQSLSCNVEMNSVRDKRSLTLHHVLHQYSVVLYLALAGGGHQERSFTAVVNFSASALDVRGRKHQTFDKVELLGTYGCSGNNCHA